MCSSGMKPNTLSLERVIIVNNLYHGREQYNWDFCYMYMCHFMQLHIWLPLNDFTMGVLRFLNVAPTQLYPNSWGYL